MCIRDRSNSYALEVFLGWKGVLAEPDYKWFSDLKKSLEKVFEPSSRAAA